VNQNLSGLEEMSDLEKDAHRLFLVFLKNGRFSFCLVFYSNSDTHKNNRVYDIVVVALILFAVVF